MSAVDATNASTATEDSHPGSGKGLYIALIPWVLFTLLAQHSTLKVASVASLVVALGIMIRSMTQNGMKVLELGAVIAFAGFTVVAFSSDHATTVWMARYARGIAAALLAAIAFGSLLFTPFTEQYAREQVPREAWGSPTFKEINRKITTMWGCIFLAMIPCHVIAGLADARITNIIFNWVAPIGLIVWGSKRSGVIADQATATA